MADVLLGNGPVFYRDKSALRFVLYSTVIGLVVPWATTALGVAFGSLPGTGSLGLTIVLAGWLLWPTMPHAAELERMGAPTSELLKVLTIGSLTNAVMYAVIGALLWYALHRRRWAWLPLVGLLGVFWWPGHSLVFR